MVIILSLQVGFDLRWVLPADALRIVAVCPEMLYSMEPSELGRRDPLDRSHSIRNRHIRGQSQQQMHVFRSHRRTEKKKPILRTGFPSQLEQLVRHCAIQDSATIFCSQHEMIVQAVLGRGGSSLFCVSGALMIEVRLCHLAPPPKPPRLPGRSFTPQSAHPLALRQG